jgi:hypothetical protein
MNCSNAICADASCIATLSGLSLRFAFPLMLSPLSVFERRASSGLSRCEYSIFSASVSRLEEPSTRRTSWSLFRSLGYGGVRDSMSGLYEGIFEVIVARFRANRGRTGTGGYDAYSRWSIDCRVGLGRSPTLRAGLLHLKSPAPMI